MIKKRYTGRMLRYSVIREKSLKIFLKVGFPRVKSYGLDFNVRLCLRGVHQTVNHLFRVVAPPTGQGRYHEGLGRGPAPKFESWVFSMGNGSGLSKKCSCAQDRVT